MKRSLLLSVVAAAGCVTDAEPYPVAAVANLVPMGADITGPIEVIGGIEAPKATSARTLAAFHVHLPDLAPRRVRVFQLNVCDMNAAPIGRDGMAHLFEISDLQEIRRVGDETHFFVPNINVEGRRIDIDTGTIQGSIASGNDGSGNSSGAIAVVQELDHDDGTQGDWLACAPFVELKVAR